MRDRLDRSDAERRQLLNMLTHQPAATVTFNIVVEQIFWEKRGRVLRMTVQMTVHFYL